MLKEQTYQEPQTLINLDSTPTITSEINQVWLKVLALLEKQIRKPSFQSWIKPVLLISLENDTATLAVRNEFTRNFLLQSYEKQIQEAVTEVLAKAVALRIVIEPNLNYTLNETNDETQMQTSLANLSSPLEKINSVNTQYKKFKNKLEAKYNFNNLYKAEFNQAAITFAQAIIHKGSALYNSLYIYAEPGLGKTHLLHALGNAVLERDRDIRVRYVKAEEFTNELIIAIQRNQTVEFRTQYRNLDLLLFDDFQFLEGKKTCQEEFLYTFDSLISSGAKVIISSNKHLDQVKLSSGLNNKLKSSLVANINCPGFNDRTEIVKQKAELSQLEINEVYAETIARKYSGSIRELEAALYQISAHKNFAGETINDALITKLFGGLGTVPLHKGLSIEQIANATADYFSLKTKELTSKSRMQDISRARHIAIFLSHELLEISYSRIGEYFGGRKHSSIIHSIKTVNSQLQSRLPSARGLSAILSEIKNRIV